MQFESFPSSPSNNPSYYPQPKHRDVRDASPLAPTLLTCGPRVGLHRHGRDACSSENEYSHPTTCLSPFSNDSQTSTVIVQGPSEAMECVGSLRVVLAAQKQQQPVHAAANEQQQHQHLIAAAAGATRRRGVRLTGQEAQGRRLLILPLPMLQRMTSGARHAGGGGYACERTHHLPPAATATAAAAALPPASASVASRTCSALVACLVQRDADSAAVDAAQAGAARRRRDNLKDEVRAAWDNKASARRPDPQRAPQRPRAVWRWEGKGKAAVRPRADWRWQGKEKAAVRPRATMVRRRSSLS